MKVHAPFVLEELKAPRADWIVGGLGRFFLVRAWIEVSEKTMRRLDRRGANLTPRCYGVCMWIPTDPRIAKEFPPELFS
jgi:hypothetical protein